MEIIKDGRILYIKEAYWGLPGIEMYYNVG